MCLIKAYRARRRIDVDHERYEPCSLQSHSDRYIQLVSPDDMYLDGSISSFPSAYTSNMRLIKADRASSRIDVDHERYEPCSL